MNIRILILCAALLLASIAPAEAGRRDNCCGPTAAEVQP